ncbi:28S ribosomal protein S29, mitochondrial [Diachasma alloeum]|uniref:28S ribosomal protein S29, mitochondrial n=1 Tax=Diachasma alloeum TaxID=454923 RepID=UPI0007381DC3|nr:28S ribosomal protein S29, mitochondrial [Diachasma alloeum]
MVLFVQLLRRIPCNVARRFATVTETKRVNDEPIQTFRTNESDPSNHGREHLNRFYTMPPSVVQTVFLHGGLPKSFHNQTTTFLETCLLVREPVLEVISCLKLTDYSRPVNRYVLYGENGAGKSLSLAHILHYGLSSRKILVHVPWVRDWYKKPKEVAASTTKEGFYDLPIDAAAWLIRFKHQNLSLLQELDLRLTKTYEWSVREHTPSGTPILELIDLGIARIKYACDIIEVLSDELKISSIAGKCKVLVVIDGFNALLGRDTEIRVENRRLVYPDKVTLTKTFLNIAKSDWCNGAVVLTVDQIAVQNEAQQSIYPRYLLGKEGFELLDPFLPVHVQNYTADEFEAVMEYYKNRKWVSDITPAGQRELELLSNRNPFKLMRLTAAL